jgi:hypothetical protein
MHTEAEAYIQQEKERESERERERERRERESLKVLPLGERKVLCLKFILDPCRQCYIEIGILNVKCFGELTTALSNKTLNGN